MRGNFTLPTAGATGTTISWESSAADVITPTGEVTRPAHDQLVATVTLTAIRGSASATRTITASVGPAPQALDYEAYFLPFFKGESTTTDVEKIYFATSQGNDPQHWQQLNNDQSVLESTRWLPSLTLCAA